MEYDDVMTRDGEGALAVRTVESSGDNYVNKDDVYTRDDEGKLCVRTTGSGGGSVDDSKIIVLASTIPTAGSSYLGKFYCYKGETDASYTHGYVYECITGIPTYTGTVSFEAATLSGTTVACSGDNFANFLTEAGDDPTTIVSGTMTYDSGADGWRLVGKDAEDNTVTSFIEYTQDYEDNGFTFTGTPENDDVIAFTCTVESTTNYVWQRRDLQPEGVTSVNGRTGAVTGVQDSTSISDVTGTTLTQEFANNTIYNCSSLTALTITLPATLDIDWACQVNFTSGTTPTSLTAPNTIKWKGDDLTADVFVPVASKRYAVLFFYDGVNVRGIVQGIA